MTSTRADELFAAVAAALDGSGPVLALAPPGAPRPPDRVPRGVAAVVPTSGSSGSARQVLLDAEALVASAAATHSRLGGPGRWLLALPVDHVAGLQVVVRSVLAGREPVVADPRDTAAIVDAVVGGLRSPGDRLRYAALVPTQLHRMVADVDVLPPGLAPLAELEAILVGGAATPPALLAHARGLGLRVVTTYGATETSGGCVYDGVPLEGVEVALDVQDASAVEGGARPGRVVGAPGDAVVSEAGLVRIAGPTLARGYVDVAGGGPSAAGFCEGDGRRWFATADLGVWSGGRLEVLGRADDVLLVGGVSVAPQAIERVVAAMPEVGEVCVVGVPDERWGQVPVAVVTCGRGVPDLDRIRRTVRGALGSEAAPRRLLVVDRLPERGPGKTDRGAVLRLVMAH